jgi:hypothetical protein
MKVRNNFFSIRVVEDWNIMPEDTKMVHSAGHFKCLYNQHRSTQPTATAKAARVGEGMDDVSGLLVWRMEISTQVSQVSITSPVSTWIGTRISRLEEKMGRVPTPYYFLGNSG